ncbi:uncharacterized protein EV420DRAFT_1555024 [Desarmillaria tabescens]|uniref:Uncharacterized protein n=1 Tax=Armillaria tabescens TaxID=1929756 RepID=A0AA39N2P1_ARMTA|nr:uncharacterized protein EV420DRAFT_1555024 [Desarmillaria tabescens]KAK0455268.1 hypothetical protein EV420DRAFT_1555024 [Desarmillaria tabescens]
MPAVLRTTRSSVTPGPAQSSRTINYNQGQDQRGQGVISKASFVEHLQSIVSRILHDPDITQRRVYSFVAPIFIFASLLLASALVPKNTHVRVWLKDVRNYKMELAFTVMAVITGIWCGLLALRWLMWNMAVWMRQFVEHDFRGLGDTGVPDSYEMIIGGLL